jgi:hypothetical protein
VKYVVAFVFCTCVFAQSQSQPFSCPSGTEDMLNYFVMAYPARVDENMGPGNANPIYSSVVPDYGNNTYAANGYFVWTKSLSGYPWDIKTYDTKFVYDRSTELGWTDPTSFKRFNIDLPMSRRCVPVGYPGSTLKIPASNTFYQSYSHCAPYLTQPLGYVVNSVSASTWVNVGNVGPTRTRYFTYRYSCDSNYANCQYKEVYSLGLGIGLFDWKYYVNKQGSFVLQQESIINQEQGGQTTPSMPCANSYE